ncbi:MAG: hypothetical protein OJF60_001733 [Burkholderiaceae bacterium]|jgi:hypothetical protein|nr:MAG: hypothetical protein OJF60_001733 [Burkholderiaceae bacterium]
MAMITCFDDLLLEAQRQPAPQQLLFVFARAELPDDATPAQRAGFEAGQGGALAPVMCVDKAAQELGSFAALAQESRQMGLDWTVVFAAALGGQGGVAPSPAAADAALQRMVESIRAGAIGGFVPFDRQGNVLQLS